jgi:Rrf2 family protein
VNSTRGTRGGYQLSRSPEAISAAAILDALEGPVALTDCSAGSGNCCLEHSCAVSRTWQRVSGAIRRSLSEISLAQLAGLDARTTTMPIERELKQFARPKVPA